MIGVTCRFLYDYHTALSTYGLIALHRLSPWMEKCNNRSSTITGPCKNQAHERQNFSSAVI